MNFDTSDLPKVIPGRFGDILNSGLIARAPLVGKDAAYLVGRGRSCWHEGGMEVRKQRFFDSATCRPLKCCVPF